VQKNNQVQKRKMKKKLLAQYGIVGFNVPLDTVYVISEMGGGAEQ